MSVYWVKWPCTHRCWTAARDDPVSKERYSYQTPASLMGSLYPKPKQGLTVEIWRPCDGVCKVIFNYWILFLAQSSIVEPTEMAQIILFFYPVYPLHFLSCLTMTALASVDCIGISLVHYVVVVHCLYIVLFSALDKITVLACDSTWVNIFYNMFLNIHQSGILTVLTWLVPHETAAVSAHSVILCTPYNHAPCYFIQSQT